ncbi:hypothetical protein DFJ58DRAFT_846205 [Suillus subalutaceus]|uniref:uncharacterized protein n=1 Tax=Suillus subalutaceus TaxID=48586 RepID=UPI001B868B55|nr:uncharacterized protein DFJ58DRAFT_846205 [Suillus subalutaceus]KAG1838084.1 hypothetical protein DFJ58DRAFT_846205 [Suillus subalutaceus]
MTSLEDYINGALNLVTLTWFNIEEYMKHVAPIDGSQMAIALQIDEKVVSYNKSHQAMPTTQLHLMKCTSNSIQQMEHITEFCLNEFWDKSMFFTLSGTNSFLNIKDVEVVVPLYDVQTSWWNWALSTLYNPATSSHSSGVGGGKSEKSKELRDCVLVTDNRTGSQLTNDQTASGSDLAVVGLDHPVSTDVISEGSGDPGETSVTKGDDDLAMSGSDTAEISHKSGV